MFHLQSDATGARNMDTLQVCVKGSKNVGNVVGIMSMENVRVGKGNVATVGVTAQQHMEGAQ